MEARCAKAKRRLACVVAITLAATTASADNEPAKLDVSLGQEKDLVFARFDISAAFNETFRRRLAGGLTSRVLIEMAVQKDGGDLIAVRVRTCEMQLHVWDDVVYTTIRDAARAHRAAYALIDDALKACGKVDVPLTTAEALNGKHPARLLVTVALNPVSAELLERTREFLSDPRGRGTGRPRAFFGAVARLFRSDSEIRGQTFVFRSGYLHIEEGP